METLTTQYHLQCAVQSETQDQHLQRNGLTIESQACFRSQVNIHTHIHTHTHANTELQTAANAQRMSQVELLRVLNADQRLAAAH